MRGRRATAPFVRFVRAPRMSADFCYSVAAMNDWLTEDVATNVRAAS